MATRAGRAAYRYVRRAPGTFAWLLVLTLTTYLISRVNPHFRGHFLRQRSTNLHELSRNPVRVLISSALWIDGGGLWVYYILYNLFHAPVERTIGTARWFFVVVAAHVGATYLSEGVVYWEVSHGYLPGSAVYTLDIGVSYALAGVEAVLAYLIAKPWCYGYGGALGVYYGYHLIAGDTFTDLGHFSALMIGFACSPLTRGHQGVWDPWAAWTAARRRLSELRAGAHGG